MLLSETQLTDVFAHFGERAVVVKHAYLDAAVRDGVSGMAQGDSVQMNPYDSYVVAFALGGMLNGQSKTETRAAAGEAFKTLLGVTHESEMALTAKGLM